MVYQIKLSKKIKRKLKKDKILFKKIIREININLLKRNPYKNTKKLKSAEDIYIFRVGSYRLFLEIDSKNKIIYIHEINHRRKSYNKENVKKVIKHFQDRLS